MLITSAQAIQKQIVVYVTSDHKLIDTRPGLAHVYSSLQLLAGYKDKRLGCQKDVGVPQL